MIRVIYPDRKGILFENGVTYKIDRDMIDILDAKNDVLASFYRMDGLAVTKCETTDFMSSNLGKLKYPSRTEAPGK